MFFDMGLYSFWVKSPILSFLGKFLEIGKAPKLIVCHTVQINREKAIFLKFLRYWAIAFTCVGTSVLSSSYLVIVATYCI